MKSKTFVSFFALIPCICASITVAQDEDLAQEQEAEIRGIADGVHETCMMPMGPVMPNGATATQAEMVTAQGALKTYLEVGNEYLGCLEEVEAGWGEEATINEIAVINYLYNSMVEDLQARAEAFNTALAAFRSKDAE